MKDKEGRPYFASVHNDREHFRTDLDVEQNRSVPDDLVVTVTLRASDLAKACGLTLDQAKRLEAHTQFYDGAVRIALRTT